MKTFTQFFEDSCMLLEQAFSIETTPVLEDFVDFCKDYLNLDSPVKVTFLEEFTGEITTGGYQPSNRQIFIYTKDRALVDVLRSVAHELVHQKQDEDGVLKSTSGETGSDHENEANATAGIIMRLYQKDNKNIY